MAFDGLVTRAVTLELADKIKYGKIEKIYQPDADELVFNIHTHAGNLKLYASCNSSHARVHLTHESFTNPAAPLAFCMLMRKHFSGGRITDIRQRETERIIEIDVETMNELGFSVNKRLIFEIMGKHSNIIALDIKSGKIIDCIKRISIDVNRVRQLLPGKIYEYPPSQGKIPLDEITEASFADIDKLFAVPMDFGKASAGSPYSSTAAAPAIDENALAKAMLGKVQGISPAVANNIAENALADFKTICNGASCEKSGAENADNERADTENISSATQSAAVCNLSAIIYEKIVQMRAAFTAYSKENHSPKAAPALTPVVYTDASGVPVEFHIFPLSAYESYYKAIRFDTVSEAAEYFYANKNSSNRIKQKSNDISHALKSALDKLYLKKQRLSEDLLKAENSDDFRLYGELLTANIHLAKAGDASVTVTNYYTGSPVTIPLDIKYSPSKNAQNYFKKYGKAKTAVKEKALQLEETERDIEYLESVSVFAANASSVEEIEELRNELVENGYLRRRKNAFRPGAAKNKTAPYEYHTSDGLRILIGRNNKENDLLTFKTAGSKDIWFHTKDIPGSHAILFTGGVSLDEISEKAIFETAALAAYHSKARESENVPVDYVPVRFVKKPNGAKPGMVIFTNNRTVWVNPKTPDSK